MAGRLGILAGGGGLPVRIIEEARRQGRPVFVVAFEGYTDPRLVDGVSHMWTQLGQVSSVLSRLKDEGVTDLVMAGHIKRPSLSSLKLDWKATRIMARLGAKAFGDDGLLGGLRQVLEEEGFTMRAAQDLSGDLLVPAGPLGRHRPDEDAVTDIRRGMEVVRKLGALDIGQAAVVQQGVVLGVEAIEGTDALILRCGPLARPGVGGVLVKCRKPGQDEHVDLPTIGPHTVESCIRAGLRGLAVEAGGALVLDRSALVARADEAGLFVIGWDAP